MNRVSIGSANGLLPIQRQAITWTSANLLSIGLPGTILSEIWMKTLSFPFKKNAFIIVVCQNDSHFVQGEMS